MATSIDDFMKTATEGQKELLFRMSDIADQEEKLVNQINEIYDARRKGVYSNGGGIAICEDKEDAMIISIGYKEELKEVREQMKNYMKRAVKDGMGHLGIIQRNYEYYVGEPLKIK